jgi:hypothetical protein
MNYNQQPTEYSQSPTGSDSVEPLVRMRHSERHIGQANLYRSALALHPDFLQPVTPDLPTTSEVQHTITERSVEDVKSVVSDMDRYRENVRGAYGDDLSEAA